MASEENELYAVKLLGNPQGNRVLANEFLAGRLGALVGLPVPELHEVELDEQVADCVRTTTDGPIGTTLGPHLGSKYPISVFQGRVYDFIPKNAALVNLRDIVGAAVFDAWTGNIDYRQFVYWRRAKEKKFHVLLIDNGYCFGGIEWNIQTRPLNPARILAGMPELMLLPTDADRFRVDGILSDWMAVFSQIEPEDIRAALHGVPHQWNATPSDLKALAGQLIVRKEWLGRISYGSATVESRSYNNQLLSRYYGHFWPSNRRVGELQ
jgi:hypothetical protein